MAEYVKVVRAGGSLVVTIPRVVRDGLGLARGDTVAFALGEDIAILYRVDAKNEPRPPQKRREEKR